MLMKYRLRSKRFKIINRLLNLSIFILLFKIDIFFLHIDIKINI